VNWTRLKSHPPYLQTSGLIVHLTITTTFGKIQSDMGTASHSCTFQERGPSGGLSYKIRPFDEGGKTTTRLGCRFNWVVSCGRWGIRNGSVFFNTMRNGRWMHSCFPRGFRKNRVS
jgi:hypothetical protein